MKKCPLDCFPKKLSGEHFLHLKPHRQSAVQTLHCNLPHLTVAERLTSYDALWTACEGRFNSSISRIPDTPVMVQIFLSRSVACSEFLGSGRPVVSGLTADAGIRRATSCNRFFQYRNVWSNPHCARSQLLRAPIMGLFRFQHRSADRRVPRCDSALRIKM